jgi:APA family basic amino acid/polyamine antiporter
VSLGILPWQEIAAREGDPVARLASQLPMVGFLAGPMAAVLAATIVLISANTGVMGASRLAYSMAELGLIGEGLSWVHPASAPRSARSCSSPAWPRRRRSSLS